MNAFGKLMIRLGAEPPPDSDFWYRPVMSGQQGFGRTGDARTVGVFAACVNLLADMLSSMEFTIYRQSRDGKEAVADHPLAYVLTVAANDRMTAHEYLHLVAQDLCIWGNHYAEIERNQRGEVMALYPVPSSRMSVVRDTRLDVVLYRWTDRFGRSRDETDSEIFHIPGLGYDGIDHIIGLSPVEMHRRSIGLAADAEGYAANYFRNNATPPAYLSNPAKQPLTEDTKTQLLNYFARTFGGVGNAGKLGILEGGVELKTVPINHRDMQFLESRKYQVEEICRIFRIPPHMVQDLGRSTNNNIEHQSIDFAVFTMSPWCERIEKRIRMQLMGVREGLTHFAKFELDSLLRGDAVSRAEYIAKRVASGTMTPNEARRRENDNPLPGGDRLYIQGAMVPLEMAGQKQETPTNAE